MLVWLGPGWLDHATLYRLTPVEQETAIDAFRGRIIQVGVGILAGGAFVFTALNYRLSREGHVTDRFTKAIEQLGSDRLDVRLGAIYALERIMADSARDHPTIVEVLAAFVREHAPRERTDSEAKVRVSLDPTLPRRPLTDVQAAATVLGRRPSGRMERGPIDLHATDLAGADLIAANLRHALLGATDLAGTNLLGANLAGADLRNVNLTDAELSQADLTEADLSEAILRKAALANTNLSGACLLRADLSSALLLDAVVKQTDFTDANLSHAVIGDLTGADIVNAILPAGYTGPNGLEACPPDDLGGLDRLPERRPLGSNARDHCPASKILVR